MDRREMLVRSLILGGGALVTFTGATFVLPAQEVQAAVLAYKLLRAEAWAKVQVGSRAWGTGNDTQGERFVENAYGMSGRYVSPGSAFRAIGWSGSPLARGSLERITRMVTRATSASLLAVTSSSR
jgi:hypothetical protein